MDTKGILASIKIHEDTKNSLFLKINETINLVEKLIFLSNLEENDNNINFYKNLLETKSKNYI